MDPTKVCTGKGAVTLRASSSYRDIPSSSPVSPQETPQYESKPGEPPLRLGAGIQVTWKGPRIHQLLPDSPRGPWVSQLFVPPGTHGDQCPELTGSPCFWQRHSSSHHFIFAFDWTGGQTPCLRTGGSADCTGEDGEAWGHGEAVERWANG